MPLLMLKDVPRYECLLELMQHFPDLDPSACEAYLYLLRAGDEASRLRENFFNLRDLSPGRFNVLMLLLDKKTGRTLSETPAELAEKAGVTRATITGLVDTLERDGLVRRQHDAGDRRMLRVCLTEKGHAALQEILPVHFKRMATLMSPLSEPERKTLARLLNKIAAQASTMALDQESASLVRTD